MGWKDLKPKINSVVIWSVKKHWLLLLIVIGTQFVTGKALADPKFPIRLSYDLLLSIHSFNGTLLFALTVLLVLQKLYLWLLRKGEL